MRCGLGTEWRLAGGREAGGWGDGKPSPGCARPTLITAVVFSRVRLEQVVAGGQLEGLERGVREAAGWRAGPRWAQPRPTMHAVLQMSAGGPYSAPISTSTARYCRVWMSSVKCLCWRQAEPWGGAGATAGLPPQSPPVVSYFL